MKVKLVLLLFCFTIGTLGAQEPERKSIRIVDTLSADETVNRNTVILRSELDSMIRLHNEALHAQLQPEPVAKADLKVLPYAIAGLVALMGIGGLLYLLYRNQRRFHRVVRMLHKQVQHLEMAAYASGSIADAGVNGKGKVKNSVPALEKKIESLQQQLDKSKAENEELQGQLTESSNARLDFESVKQLMMEVYKIRNYPGFNKEKTETEIVKSMLDTERSVALYAYEHFLKPVMVIADANKNNPAKINPEEREKLVDLLISLGLLYSEYLYLRINELSVGGRIVERLGSLKNGNSLDPATLKELSTEHGSRALVIRMALDKTSIQKLSYPVFDETNLNLS